MQGKTKINPSIIVRILFKFPFNITEYIDENIAAKQVFLYLLEDENALGINSSIFFH